MKIYIFFFFSILFPSSPHLKKIIAEELLVDNPYRYLTGDEMKFLGDDSLPIDVTKDERMNDTFGRDSLGMFIC